MNLALGLLLSLLIGISLGVFGAGGSILTLPILHYVLGFSAIEATAMSLFVVGSTALAGVISYTRRNEVAWKQGLWFATPSLLTVLITKRLILPVIPDSFLLFNYSIQKGSLLLIIFSVIMLLASASMIKPNRNLATKQEDRITNTRPLGIIIQGMITGLISGFVGAGGGFVIVPALVVFLKLPIKSAMGTALLIIFLNSFFGFTSDVYAGFKFNWHYLFLITSFSLAGMFLGNKIIAKMNAQTLKPAFGWFVLVMGFAILVKEVL